MSKTKTLLMIFTIASLSAPDGQAQILKNGIFGLKKKREERRREKERKSKQKKYSKTTKKKVKTKPSYNSTYSPSTIKDSSILPFSLEKTANYSKKFTGSTSCGMAAFKNSKAIGGFYPKCSATNPNTEVAYYKMAKIFGYAQYVQPAIPYDLGPKGINVFRSIIAQRAKDGYKGDHQAKNCREVLAATENRNAKIPGSSSSLPGVFKNWQAGKPVEYSNFVFWKENSVNKADPIFKLVQASSPRVQNRTIKFGRFSGNELEMAKVTSLMFTLDALFGQWDRHSGGNVQLLRKSNGQYKLYIVDNGGATLARDPKWTRKHLSLFSRFNLDVVKDVESLSSFLAGEKNSFAGYSSVHSFLKDGLGLRTVYGGDIETFRQRLLRNAEMFLNRVQQVRSKYSKKDIFL